MPDPIDTSSSHLKELATQQALKNSSTMAGGGTMGTNPSAPGCSTGKPSDQQGGAPSDPGATQPGGCGNVVQKQAGIRSKPISSGLHGILSKSASSINANFVVTSGGQHPEGEGAHTGSSRHDNQGSAAGALGSADGYFQDCSTGRILSTANSADRTRLASGLGTAYQNGATGLGSNYMNGMGGAGRDELFHIGGGTDKVWGGDTAFLRDAKAGRTPAAVAGGPATAGGNSNGSDCGGGDGGGCQPINSTAPAVASSVNQGQGLNPAAALTSGIEGITSTLTGGLGSTIQQALGSLTGGASNLLSSLSGLTSQATSLIQNLGAGVFPALTGVIPSGISNLLGSGSLTGMVQGFAGSVIQQNVPQLGGFTSVLNSAMSASESGGNMMNSVMGSGNQIFGNSEGAMSRLPGASSVGAMHATDLTIANSSSTKLTGSIPIVIDPDDPDLGLGDNGYEEILLRRLDNRVNLIGPIDEVLARLNQKNVVDGFSSLHYDYHSLVTQGFGSLTNSVVDLGNDLAMLGQLGDLTDLFNLATPQQFARQLIENGFGISSGLLPLFMENGLELSSLYTRNNTTEIYNMLASITDEELIADVKSHFKIDESLVFESLGDFVDPTKIFPTSYDYNSFTYLEEVATFLSLYNMGRIKTLGQLGNLLASLETIETYEDLLNENTVIRQTEAAGYFNSMIFASKFGFSGPTIADFIGTAAGYIHSDTFPAMATLLNGIDESPYMTEFQSLMQLLAETLNGDYTTGIDITVPNTVDYTFGTYLNLDDATGALVTAIEEELQYLKDELETLDFDTWLKIQYLETYHWESARYLEHEKRMRKLYGIDLGEPRRTSEFRADGSTAIFKLEEDKSTGHLVYVDGVFFPKRGNWTYTVSTNSITFESAPLSGVTVTIVYDVDTFIPSTTDADGWQFAANLENYALMGGYGNVSDFLSRITTDDIHGQRINAILRQSRNKNRLSEAGMLQPNFDTITDSNNDNSSFNYADFTGIWSTDIDRAAEIYVQNSADVDTFEQYIVQSYVKNKTVMQQDMDILLQNIVRQLIFFTEGNLAVSDLMINLYQTNQNNEIYAAERNDLLVPYSNDLPADGYVLGPYREILSTIASVEGLTNDVFNDKLSVETENYLKEFNFSIKLMVTIVQRVLMVNVSQHLGLAEGDAQAIFGTQSAFKTLLQNIANNY